VIVFGKRSGFTPSALGFLLIIGLYLAPAAARAGTIDFNTAMTGQTGLSWSAGANWVGGASPGAGSDVFLTSATGGALLTTTMNFDAGTLSLHSLTMDQTGGGGGSLTLNLAGGNALTAVNETIGVTGADPSVINQTGGSNTVTGTLTLSSNSVTNATSLTAAYQFNGGTLNASSIVNNAGGKVEIGFGGFVNFGNAGGNVLNYNTLTNQGIFTTQNPSFTTPAGSVINNQNGGFTSIVSGATFQNTGAATSFSNATNSILVNDANMNNVYGATLTNSGGSTLYNGVSATVSPTTPLFGATQGLTAQAAFLANSLGATLTNTDAGTTLYNVNGSELVNDGATTGSSNTSLLRNLAGATLTSSDAGTTLYNQDGGTLTNDNSTLNNLAGATLTNTGTNGIVISSITNQNGAALTNDNSALNNLAGATLTNTGTNGVAVSTITNQNGATLTNDNSVLNNLAGATLTNTGTNGGAASTITNQNGATLTNDNSVLNNLAGATLTNTGSNGLAGSTMTNQDGATLTNDASTLQNLSGATLTNTDPGTFFSNQNGATLTNAAGAALNNANSAFLFNQTGAILTNNGSLNNSASVFNYSVINGSGTYTQLAGSQPVGFAGEGLTYVASGSSFTQGTLQIQGGEFDDNGAVTITGNAAISGGNLTIDGVTMTVDGAYNQACANCLTLLNGGTLDPTAINIDGGAFGGSGEVDGNVTLTGDSILQVGDPGGQLTINGNYSQTGGDVVFDIASDGHGGFVESSLNFNPSAIVAFDDVVIEFDFLNGADPAVFTADGLFNIDTFFTDGLGNIFSSDTFEEEFNSQTNPVNFDSSNGDLTPGASGTPEPGTLLLLAAGLGILGLARRCSAGGLAAGVFSRS
jgi:hypothetical protein